MSENTEQLLQNEGIESVGDHFYVFTNDACRVVLLIVDDYALVDSAKGDLVACANVLEATLRVLRGA